MCLESLSFIPHTLDKTKCTVKEKQYETNSKENPVYIKSMTTSIFNVIIFSISLWSIYIYIILILTTYVTNKKEHSQHSQKLVQI